MTFRGYHPFHSDTIYSKVASYIKDNCVSSDRLVFVVLPDEKLNRPVHAFIADSDGRVVFDTESSLNPLVDFENKTYVRKEKSGTRWYKLSTDLDVETVLGERNVDTKFLVRKNNE